MMSALHGAIECFYEESRCCGSFYLGRSIRADSRVDCIEPTTSRSTDTGSDSQTGSCMNEYTNELQMGFLVCP